MKQNNCILLLNTFSKKELTLFDKYLNGLYGKQIKVVEAYSYIKKNLPIDDDSNKLDKEYMVGKFFKGAKDADKKLSNLIGKLKLIVEEFLRWQRVNNESNGFDKNRLMIEVYKERNFDNLFFNTIEKTKESIWGEVIDMWTPLKLMQLHHLAFFTTKTSKTINKSEELQAALSQLDLFFLFTKLKYSSEVQNRMNIIADKEYENWLLPHLLDKQANKLKQNQYSAMYLEVLQLLRTKKVVHYESIKKKFPDYLASTHPRDALIILTHLFNFIAIKFREGDIITYAKDYLELYISSLSAGILQIDGYLDIYYFVNTINVACRLKKYTWVEHFLNENLNCIDVKEQLVVKQLSMGILLYEQGKYEDALVQVKSATYSNPIFSLRLKVLEIKILVDLKVMDKSIVASCEAFDQFIRRQNKLSDRILDAYKNFVLMVRRIFLYKKKDQAQLLAYLDENPPLVQKDWLKAKINEMKAPPTANIGGT